MIQRTLYRTWPWSFRSKDSWSSISCVVYTDATLSSFSNSILIVSHHSRNHVLLVLLSLFSLLKLLLLFSIVEVILLIWELSHGNHKISDNSLKCLSFVHIVKELHHVSLNLHLVEIWECFHDFLHKHVQNELLIWWELMWVSARVIDLSLNLFLVNQIKQLHENLVL